MGASFVLCVLVYVSTPSSRRDQTNTTIRADPVWTKQAIFVCSLFLSIFPFHVKRYFDRPISTTFRKFCYPMNCQNTKKNNKSKKKNCSTIWHTPTWTAIRRLDVWKHSKVLVFRARRIWRWILLCGSGLSSWNTDMWDQTCMLVTANYCSGSSSTNSHTSGLQHATFHHASVFWIISVFNK
jgi:hypothetical protein